MKLIVLLSLLTAPIASGQMHRAEQDREIRYWLLDPATHEFKISHDFNVTRVGQKSVHSFVRKGSTVVQSQIFDLDTGEELKTYNVTGKDTNALGYYPSAVPDDEVVVQGDLPHPIEAGQSVRIRVVETYMDPAYAAKNGELVWDRTLGRPRNEVTLPDGWMLTQVSVPAIISLDPQGRITCRFTNPRNDEIHVVLKARRRPGTARPAPSN
ncbi:MAG TPA: hypothetical protein VFA65_10060 [Bryobacteraceae bacterium]|nr:hypothetical protein [Bryobacteraceae bacterium]